MPERLPTEAELKEAIIRRYSDDPPYTMCGNDSQLQALWDEWEDHGLETGQYIGLDETMPDNEFLRSMAVQRVSDGSAGRNDVHSERTRLLLLAIRAQNFGALMYDCGGSRDDALEHQRSRYTPIVNQEEGEQLVAWDIEARRLTANGQNPGQGNSEDLWNRALEEAIVRPYADEMYSMRGNDAQLHQLWNLCEQRGLGTGQYIGLDETMPDNEFLRSMAEQRVADGSAGRNDVHSERMRLRLLAIRAQNFGALMRDCGGSRNGALEHQEYRYAPVVTRQEGERMLAWDMAARRLTANGQNLHGAAPVLPLNDLGITATRAPRENRGNLSRPSLSDFATNQDDRNANGTRPAGRFR
ncbi:hypothetical protein RJT17_36045 [Streptomyces sp. P5-A9]|uniref:hypothetical protein n=1 Tax=Streptomyces sp. P5-A9 TaxID=3071730 RepID=UPI002FC60601